MARICEDGSVDGGGECVRTEEADEEWRSRLFTVRWRVIRVQYQDRERERVSFVCESAEQRSSS